VENQATLTGSIRYEFDGSSFRGTLRLNADTRRTILGPFTYTVAGIEDNAYGLDAFNSNSLLVIFDRITLKHTIHTYSR